MVGGYGFACCFGRMVVRYGKIGYNLDVLRRGLHAWLLVRSGLAALLASLIARR